MPLHKTRQHNPYLAGILAWMVPGAGYWYIGEKRRGTIVCVAILLTFAIGVMLGGVQMVGWAKSKWWFLAQILAGMPAVIPAVLANPLLPDNFGRAVEHCQVYTGVAGLLNLLCVLDTIARTTGDHPHLRKETPTPTPADESPSS